MRLYSTSPFVRHLQERRFSFFLVAKPGDHKTLYAEIEGLRQCGMLGRLEVQGEKGRRYVYEWVNGIALNSVANSPMVNYMQLTILDPAGEVKYRNSWVTDITVSKENVRHLVRGARARWKKRERGVQHSEEPKAIT